MHIAQIFSHTIINGVTTSGRTLVQSLLDRGHRVTVMHRPGAWIAEQPFSGDVSFSELDMGVRLLNYKTIAKIQHDCANNNVDIIHSHGDVASRITSHIRMFSRLRSVATRHNMNFHPHWRFQNAVIAPSQATAKELRRQHLVSRRRLHVIPNFLAQDISQKSSSSAAQGLRASLGIAQDAFVLVAVGEINSRKNQSAIPAIIHDLQKRGITAHAILIGRKDGIENLKVSQNAQNFGLDHQIHMTGERKDVSDFLTVADGYISTSHAEQGSIALLEALAAGLPAFCTNVGSAPEIIVNRETGHLLDLRASSEALDEIVRIASNTSALKRARLTCQQHFYQNFSTQKVVPRIEDLYTRLTA